MKKNILLFSALLYLMLLSSCSNNQTDNHKTLFDFDWKFALGDHPGAKEPEYDDSAWKTLDIPHDFSIEQPFDSLNQTGRDGGYTYSGIGWYRKHFILPKSTSGKRVVILFNGIYRNSEVRNGEWL